MIARSLVDACRRKFEATGLLQSSIRHYINNHVTRYVIAKKLRGVSQTAFNILKERTLQPPKARKIKQEAVEWKAIDSIAFIHEIQASDLGPTLSIKNSFSSSDLYFHLIFRIGNWYVLLTRTFEMIIFIYYGA